ncbi:uncharacterized protein LOC114138491 [Xiphophorus couchianus]|uniref:uncharacterized protein LOC114138491 n=1 Tax=Xiphophorus couchianus TaxID=32473 RepID=UPI0010165716|nr:uncharacterized protein LOC114138491 [Xiphophorus couchianus]XP_027863596.1 uncharacterized protein LOC114138491 [Xiphophorus couchianus]XP_027863597.1 uncharacterized protein LOC114138491 [Xiphophorus couchianus]XP_027863598.1 uncharacterized protein LOC114138491 [Xiphophorus couchianus]
MNIYANINCIMGQLMSSEEELAELKKTAGCVMYDAMVEGGAVPDLAVVHPLLLANQNEDPVSQTSLQEHLKQIQSDLGKRAPTYLRDLIGRLSAFSDEPRLAGLVGLAVTMVMDVAWSSKQSAGVKGSPAASSSCQQRVWELQEVMEEYLKRCRISLSDKRRLIEDSVRLEAQLSLILTRLKTCLLGGGCDSRSLRHWACGAAFHTQMLVHLACFEDKAEPLSARAAMDQYLEDLKQIIAAYRCYKSITVCVLKCRGGLLAKSDHSQDMPEEGAMTGLTVTDRETGKSVTIALSVLEDEIGRRKLNSGTVTSSQVNLDLITSDIYSQAYLDHLFSDKGPVAELENYFVNASERLAMHRTDLQRKNKTGARKAVEKSEDGHVLDEAQVPSDKERAETKPKGEEPKESSERDASLKFSIVETEPEESPTRTQPDSASAESSRSQSAAEGK